MGVGSGAWFGLFISSEPGAIGPSSDFNKCPSKIRLPSVEQLMSRRVPRRKFGISATPDASISISFSIATTLRLHLNEPHHLESSPVGLDPLKIKKCHTAVEPQYVTLSDPFNMLRRSSTLNSCNLATWPGSIDTEVMRSAWAYCPAKDMLTKRTRNRSNRYFMAYLPNVVYATAGWLIGIC